MIERFGSLFFRAKIIADSMGLTKAGRERIYSKKLEIARNFFIESILTPEIENPLRCPDENWFFPSVESDLTEKGAREFGISESDYRKLKNQVKDKAKEIHLEYLKTYTGDIACIHGSISDKERAIIAQSYRERYNNYYKRHRGKTILGRQRR